MRRLSLSVVTLLLSLCVALATQEAIAQTGPGPAGSPSARILVLGDSLSAEYGLPRGTGWVDLLKRRLRDDNPVYQVINASISGETTSGGAARLPDLLREHQPGIVVLELGGNDALRGLQAAMTETNLREMARQARGTGAQVVIVGMQIPPNYGRAYAERFRSMFASVASEEKAALVPFLLEGIASDPNMFQADRIHPTAEAQTVLLDNVWPVLQPLL